MIFADVNTCKYITQNAARQTLITAFLRHLTIFLAIQLGYGPEG